MGVYEATVTFFAEGEAYGKESFLVRAESEKAAAEHAVTLSDGSRFRDDRIDFTRGVDLSEREPEPGDVIHDAPPAVRRFGPAA